MFYWQEKMYVLENIPCKYWGHAGIWDPSYGNKSYARIRDFQTGVVVVNISSSIGYGFISALPDYDHGTLWLFGTHADRCARNSPNGGQLTKVRSPRCSISPHPRASALSQQLPRDGPEALVHSISCKLNQQSRCSHPLNISALRL